MDDLISRQAVIELWEKYHPIIAIDAFGYDKELRSIPLTEPEIIYCKDCKHYQEDHLFRIGFCDGRQRNNDDFCSRAERIDNG